MKVNIFDVAERSGLSVVTVSRVINNSHNVREKNRQKVLQAIKELDYRPSAAARSLARGKTGIIGLAIITLQDHFLDEVIQAINDHLQENGYLLTLFVSSGLEESFYDSFYQEDRVDGLIILSPIHEHKYVTELKKKKIPFVMLDNQHKNPSVPSVLVDNFKGGYEATNHLIQLGHKQIAHIRGSDIFLSARERERGFMAALADNGMEPFVVEDGEFDVSTGYRIVKQWIKEHKLPTAVFAADDNIALGVIDALKEEGIKVPHQVSVVGYDDHPFASQLHPLLTTVRQPADKVAKLGVELLLNLINGTPKRNVTSQLEPELIVRYSTAPTSCQQP